MSILKRVIKQSFLITALCVGAMTSLPAEEYADQQTKEMMANQLDTIKGIYEAKYAPFQWKNEYCDWDLDQEIEKAKQRIYESKDLTLKKYQRIVKDFFKSTKDYHVSVYFYSTEYAYLPFRVKGAEGKYFVVHIDEDWVSDYGIPIALGDEVVAFNGEPVGDIINKIVEEEERSASPQTDLSMAEELLTIRVGVFGMEVPNGKVNLTVKDPDGLTKHIIVDWFYNPEKITPHSSFGQAEAKDPFSDASAKDKISNWMSTHQHKWNSYLQGKLPNKHYSMEDVHGIGSRKSFVPPLGRIIFETDESHPFYAYKFIGQDRKIYGYIRIPTFMEASYAAECFGDLIRDFEKTTDALVIDEVNNPGGYGLYMAALISYLATDTVYMPYEQFKLTQGDIYFAHDILEDLKTIHSDEYARDVFGDDYYGHHVDLKFVHSLVEFFQFQIDEWNAGRVLTDKIHGFGIQSVEPRTDCHYTKPILVLVNEGSISCGDYFPATLQDHSRAVIFGVKTSGAGGAVSSVRLPNLFGLYQFSYTQTIAERLNGDPIENLGVQPDVPYELKEDDLRNNFEGYKTAVLETLKSMTD